jgi:branched-chain amino acid transport system substrate-binding protein
MNIKIICLLGNLRPAGNSATIACRCDGRQLLRIGLARKKKPRVETGSLSMSVYVPSNSGSINPMIRGGQAMKSKIRFRVLGVALFLMFTLMVGTVLWTAPLSFAAQTYKVGVLQPYTGTWAHWGRTALEACRMGADEINAGGGILGRQVEILSRDEKSQVDVALREAKDLILRGGVDAIIGVQSSAANLGVIEVTKEYKVIHMANMAATERTSLERIHPYYFQINANTYMESISLAKFAIKMGIKNYVTIASDFEWGHSTVDNFTPVMERERPDVKWTKKFWPKVGEIDFTPYITAILSEKPDICFGVLSGADSVNFIKQARGYGFFEKVRYVCPSFEDDLIDLGAEFPEGVLIYSRAPFYGIDTPKMRAFQEKFILKTGRYPSNWAILSYDSFMTLMEAIKRARSFDKDAVAKTLEGGKFNTLRGDFYIRPIDHSMNSPIYFSTSYFDKAKGFCIGKNVTVVAGEDCWRTPEDIKKIRAEKGIVFKPWNEK